MLYVIVYPLLIFKLFRDEKVYNQEFRDKYEGLFEVYKEDKLRTIAFDVVILGKKFLIAISLVFLGFYPLI